MGLDTDFLGHIGLGFTYGNAEVFEEQWEAFKVACSDKHIDGYPLLWEFGGDHIRPIIEGPEGRYRGDVSAWALWLEYVRIKFILKYNIQICSGTLVFQTCCGDIFSGILQLTPDTVKSHVITSDGTMHTQTHTLTTAPDVTMETAATNNTHPFYSGGRLWHLPESMWPKSEEFVHNPTVSRPHPPNFPYGRTPVDSG